MATFLRVFLPRLLPRNCKHEFRVFRGKPDLLKKLKKRLLVYRRRLPPNYRIVVMIDRDNDDCQKLKKQLDSTAIASGLRIRSQPDACWQVVNRIVIEELEAWYFGDWEAVRCAYPKVPKISQTEQTIAIPMLSPAGPVKLSSAS